jgi:ABC-type amino acid transport substrate-binding protein
MTIATRHAPPFAIKADDGQWSGIAIELSDRISERTGYDFRYTELGLRILWISRSVPAQVVARKNCEVDQRPDRMSGSGVRPQSSPAQWTAGFR